MANASSRSSKKSEENLIPLQKDFFGSMKEDYLLKPPFLMTTAYLNLAFVYFVTLMIISGHSFSYWYGLLYIPFLYFLYNWRIAYKNQKRLQVAHRIPFFADSLANALSVGANLESAFEQAAYYLKGEIKIEFNKLIVKNALGKDLGGLLRELDSKFPRTGMRYLISLLEQFCVLGVGISPLLKKMADALTKKEEAEEKIRTILAAGSNYARLSIGVFVCLFLAMSYILKDQVQILMTPNLKPIFIFLLVWTCVGILIVTRITSLEFAKNFALRPHITQFMKVKKFELKDLFRYSGYEWPIWAQQLIMYAPLAVGFFCAYAVSWYHGSTLYVVGGFLGGVVLCKYFTEYILKGMVEDQLIQVIETFPDVLQVFIIGLNSGLNYYLAFQFAEDAVKGTAPKILTEELCRTKFAMECGEPHSFTWQKLAEKLPFETVVDFCEIMVVAPMQGESIVKSIAQMTNGYQVKKLTLVEKKAVKLGQMVIPIIVMAFFPLFLFVIFAPLLSQISVLFNI